MKKYYNLGLMALVLSLVFLPNAFAAATSSDVQVSLLKYSPSPAEPGNYLTLTFKVENNGTADSNDVRLKLSPDYPFSLDNNATVYIRNSAESLPIGSDNTVSLGGVPLSEYTIAEYKVRVDPSALEGYNQISIFHQVGSSDIWVEDKLDVFVQGTDMLEVSDVEPSILTPGNPTDVIFVLKNSGTASLREISFSWADSDNKILPLGSGNVKYIKSLTEGEIAELPFTLVADPGASSGVYTLNANLSYTIGVNTTKTQRINIGMFIGGKGEFDVSTQESVSGSVTLSIANIGETTANSVSVSIPEQDNFVVTGTSSSFIGNMNPGDFLTATFQISSRNAGFGNRTARPMNASSDTLKVDVAYTDTNGNRETIRKEVRFSSAGTTFSSSTGSNVSTNFGGRNNGFGLFGSTGNSSGSMTIVIIVAAIFLVIILFIFRKKIMGFFRKNKR